MPFPASGGAKFSYAAAKSIRFAYHGCANRPFFHIVVMDKRKSRQGHVIEQLGTYDPMINSNSEKLCSLNLERINYWIGCGASMSTPCAELLGLAGLIPIHPHSYITAWRARRKQAEEKAKESSSAEEV